MQLLGKFSELGTGKFSVPSKGEFGGFVPGDFLQVGNNLSDVASKPTSLRNLGQTTGYELIADELDRVYTTATLPTQIYANYITNPAATIAFPAMNLTSSPLPGVVMSWFRNIGVQEVNLLDNASAIFAKVLPGESGIVFAQNSTATGGMTFVPDESLAVTFQDVYGNSTNLGTAPAEIKLDAAGNPVTFKNNTDEVILNIAPSLITSSKQVNNVLGAQTFLISNQITTNVNLDATIVGKLNINQTAADHTITAVLGDTLPIGASFDMLRANLGTFTFAVPAGVTLNTIPGPFSISLNQSLAFLQRMNVVKTATNQYYAVIYSDSVITTPPLQDVYTAGSTILYSNGNPIEITLPNDTTDLFNVINNQNGADGNQLSRIVYSGKDDLGTSFNYHEDKLEYRLNLTAPIRIQSAKREFNLLENGVLTPYVDFDAGFRTINFYKNTNIFDAVCTIERSDTLVNDLRFFTSIDSVVNQTVLQISSRSNSDTSILKTADLIKLQVSDPTNATFSQRFRMNAYQNNSAVDFLEFDGIADTTKVRRSSTKILSEIATIPDITLQDAYLGGNIIDLDGVDDFVIRNSSFGTIFRAFDNFGALGSVGFFGVPIIAEELVRVQSANLTVPCNVELDMQFPVILGTTIGLLESFAENSTATKKLFWHKDIIAGTVINGTEDGILREYLINAGSDRLCFEIDATPATPTTKIIRAATGTLEQVATIPDIPVIGTISSGTTGFSISSSSGLTSSSILGQSYLRIGNIVHGAISFTFNPSSMSSQIRFSIPFNIGNFTSNYECNGVMTANRTPIVTNTDAFQGAFAVTSDNKIFCNMVVAVTGVVYIGTTNFSYEIK